MSEDSSYVENLRLPDGSLYTGEVLKLPFDRLEISGSGTVNYPNGDRYEGSFKYGRPFGWGKYTFKNGHTHKGYFDNYPNGIGYLNEDYSMCLGNFAEGRLQGWGIRYVNHIFKFGYWTKGFLSNDYSKYTLDTRKEVTHERKYYRGNLIQIGKDYSWIRFGIPAKVLLPQIGDRPAIKSPAIGFEFCADGTVKIGYIQNHSSGDYILCKTDLSMIYGKWNDNQLIHTYELSSLIKDLSKYDEDGINVY